MSMHTVSFKGTNGFVKLSESGIYTLVKGSKISAQDGTVELLSEIVNIDSESSKIKGVFNMFVSNSNGDKISQSLKDQVILPSNPDNFTSWKSALDGSRAKDGSITSVSGDYFEVSVPEGSHDVKSLLNTIADLITDEAIDRGINLTVGVNTSESIQEDSNSVSIATIGTSSVPVTELILSTSRTNESDASKYLPTASASNLFDAAVPHVVAPLDNPSFITYPRDIKVAMNDLKTYLFYTRNSSVEEVIIGTRASGLADINTSRKVEIPDITWLNPVNSKYYYITAPQYLPGSNKRYADNSLNNTYPVTGSHHVPQPFDSEPSIAYGLLKVVDHSSVYTITSELLSSSSTSPNKIKYEPQRDIFYASFTDKIVDVNRSTGAIINYKASLELPSEFVFSGTSLAYTLHTTVLSGLNGSVRIDLPKTNSALLYFSLSVDGYICVRASIVPEPGYDFSNGDSEFRIALSYEYYNSTSTFHGNGGYADISSPDSAQFSGYDPKCGRILSEKLKYSDYAKVADVHGNKAFEISVFLLGIPVVLQNNNVYTTYCPAASIVAANGQSSKNILFPTDQSPSKDMKQTLISLPPIEGGTSTNNPDMNPSPGSGTTSFGSAFILPEINCVKPTLDSRIDNVDFVYKVDLTGVSVLASNLVIGTRAKVKMFPVFPSAAFDKDNIELFTGMHTNFTPGKCPINIASDYADSDILILNPISVDTDLFEVSLPNTAKKEYDVFSEYIDDPLDFTPANPPIIDPSLDFDDHAFFPAMLMVQSECTSQEDIYKTHVPLSFSAPQFIRSYDISDVGSNGYQTYNGELPTSGDVSNVRFTIKVPRSVSSNIFTSDMHMYTPQQLVMLVRDSTGEMLSHKYVRPTNSGMMNGMYKNIYNSDATRMVKKYIDSDDYATLVRDVDAGVITDHTSCMGECYHKKIVQLCTNPIMGEFHQGNKDRCIDLSIEEVGYASSFLVHKGLAAYGCMDHKSYAYAEVDFDIPYDDLGDLYIAVAYPTLGETATSYSASENFVYGSPSDDPGNKYISYFHTDLTKAEEEWGVGVPTTVQVSNDNLFGVGITRTIYVNKIAGGTVYASSIGDHFDQRRTPIFELTSAFYPDYGIPQPESVPDAIEHNHTVMYGQSHHFSTYYYGDLHTTGHHNTALSVGSTYPPNTVLGADLVLYSTPVIERLGFKRYQKTRYPSNIVHDDKYEFPYTFFNAFGSIPLESGSLTGNFNMLKNPPEGYIILSRVPIQGSANGKTAAIIATSQEISPPKIISIGRARAGIQYNVKFSSGYAECLEDTVIMSNGMRLEIINKDGSPISDSIIIDNSSLGSSPGSPITKVTLSLKIEHPTVITPQAINNNPWNMTQSLSNPQKRAKF